MKIRKNIIYFAKTHPDAIIPSKNVEDAGYDFFPNFTNDYVIIYPSEIKKIPTGIASAFSSKYVLIIKEKSSTGNKCMSIRMGVIDSGYRGEINIGINNTTNKPIMITKDRNFKDEKYIIYPYAKAIAQGILLLIPKMNVKEVSYNKLSTFISERMDKSSGIKYV